LFLATLTLLIQEIETVPDLHIHRTHQLGLARARQVAQQWAEEAITKLDMECVLMPGDDGDTLEFKRIGVKGQLRVEADQFTLNATLGFLLGAFSKTIASEIERNLDDLLYDESENSASQSPSQDLG
jgi:putative polyhydroxyalkanoate system protein